MVLAKNNHRPKRRNKKSSDKRNLTMILIPKIFQKENFARRLFCLKTKKSRRLSLPLGEIRRITRFAGELCGVKPKAD